jgi:ABC-type molybdate transport system ATPase subunit
MARTYRRAAGASFDEAFGDALLGPLLKRSSGSLNEPERRAVALTLALELDTPSVLLLYEPRATPLDFAKVRERYSHHAHLAPVLVVSDRERELLHFGSRRFGESRQGRTLHRIVATRVNELARVLESKGHQVAVLAEMTGTGLLEVRADSPENLSALLLESCRACGAELRSLRWEKGDE